MEAERAGLSLGSPLCWLCLDEVFFFPPPPTALSFSSYPNSLVSKLRRKTNTSQTVTERAIKETFGQWYWRPLSWLRVNTKGSG